MQKIKLNVDGGECAIVVRADLSIETYARLSQTIEASQLLALGLTWALENEEWTDRLMRKARSRVLQILEERGSADEDVVLIDTHT
tara:strand:- start:1417 stop:1674 length:258 start_codon:yes stop_codon:yes gene_type:complete